MPLCGAFVIPRLNAAAPNGEAYRINGTIPAATWSRDQVLVAINGVGLEGPPCPPLVCSRPSTVVADDS